MRLYQSMRHERESEEGKKSFPNQNLTFQYIWFRVVQAEQDYRGISCISSIPGLLD